MADPRDGNSFFFITKVVFENYYELDNNVCYVVFR